MKRKQSTLHFGLSTRNRRHATSVLETIVALTLLLTALSLSVSLVVRHGHLLVAQRHYRQALDELSNQLDMLTSLPAADVPQALKQLSISEFAAGRLAAAKLDGEVTPADIGQRITLHLTWNDLHEQSVSMTGWTLPRPGSER